MLQEQHPNQQARQHIQQHTHTHTHILREDDRERLSLPPSPSPSPSHQPRRDYNATETHKSSEVQNTFPDDETATMLAQLFFRVSTQSVDPVDWDDVLGDHTLDLVLIAGVAAWPATSLAEAVAPLPSCPHKRTREEQLLAAYHMRDGNLHMHTTHRHTHTPSLLTLEGVSLPTVHIHCPTKW